MTPRTVVVAGSLAHHRGRGDRAWVFLHYLLGFRRLGWEVLFVDRIEPEHSRDKRGRPCPPEHSEAFRYLTQVMDGFGLEKDFAAICDGGATVLGVPRRQILERTRRGPLLLDIMGFLGDEEILAAAPLSVIVETHPGAEPITAHDARLATSGPDIVGRSPAGGGARAASLTAPPPVVRALWEPPNPPSNRGGGGSFTGLARSAESAALHNGSRGGIPDQLVLLMPLPVLSHARFELAFEITPENREGRSLLAGNGWTVLNPAVVTGDPWSYRSFIQHSSAGLVVSDDGGGSRSGWMNERPTCYLASGRPVLAQETGIDSRYPTGDGLLTFRTLDEAWAGVEEIQSRYDHHARAARDMAAEYFESDLVLRHLTDVLIHG